MKPVEETRLERLKTLIQQHGSAAALNRAAGRNERDSTFSQIMTGALNSKTQKPKSMGSDLARQLEASLGLGRGWMDTPDEVTPYSVQENQAAYLVSKRADADITIPQYDPMELAGSMGRGLELRDQPGVIQSWRVSKDWLHQNVKAHSGNANLCIVTGFGDSMQPMFNPGDPLLVDIGVTSVEFDSVYFFRVGNEGFIKRLQRIPTENGLLVRAISENKTAYESFDITTKMDFQVLGRVLKVWRSQEF